MTYINQKYLTVGEAKELEQRGFIVKFVDVTYKGLIFDVWARA